MTAAVRIGPASALRQSLALAGRGVVRIRKNPDTLLDVTVQPILMLLLFSFLFSGAIADGDHAGYLQQLVPGLMVFGTLYVSVGTGVALCTDVAKGVFDRFRSLPIARSAPLAGAVLGDVVRYLIAVLVLLVVGVVLGFRVQTGPLPVVAAMALMVAFGLCLCWVSVLVGLLVRSPAAVPGLLFAVIMPLSFGSSVFVPAATMPDWLRVWAEVNVVTLLSEVNRGLLVTGTVPGGALLGALMWMAGFVLVFFPLAARAYRRRLT
ncbi:ABC transporter permease [Amycolatopsis sp. 195334CR]|uniref:ABC transporter permease n=1 Tax=Amycolatopsis sp. 195334CR TaxID=2814588 RepID=UPI001A8D63C8|nr:ABC transporter permease [Amycolatopsis sp. 195334CR]MBN6039775.1 ABC transporter permease [Amycolatopsis sp. 195334CR]